MQASMSPSSSQVLRPSQVSLVAEWDNFISPFFSFSSSWTLPPSSAFLGTGGGALTGGGVLVELLVSFCLLTFPFSTLDEGCGCGTGAVIFVLLLVVVILLLVILLVEGGFSFFFFSSLTTGFGSEFFSLGGGES